jgi:hypothetical protein
LTAFICFIGGLLRIIYALLFEEPYPTVGQQTAAPREPVTLTGARRRKS